jgi:hypothetical protein
MEEFKFKPNIDNKVEKDISKKTEKLERKLGKLKEQFSYINKEHNKYLSLSSSHENDSYPKLAKEFERKILEEKDKTEMDITKKKLILMNNISIN